MGTIFLDSATVGHLSLINLQLSSQPQERLELWLFTLVLKHLGDTELIKEVVIALLLRPI